MKLLVDGYVPTDICEVCILAKHERKIIQVPVLRTTTPFELVHSDTCGPFNTKSHGGGLHFIVFIDDYTHHTTVYILLDKRAESCISAFQSFKARIESWDYTIKRFRCDNGRGEYDNTLFRRILAGSGISFEPSPPYTQHKNGVAERMIGTLTEKARAMMLDSQAPKQFWVEAVRTASYLHARTPSRTLDGKSPYEMLHRHRRLQRHLTDVDAVADRNAKQCLTDVNANTDHTEDDKPKLHHLRRFGCLAYRRIPKEQRIDTKMGARSKPCMMLGYVHNTTKIWRIWDPEQRKVVNCSDVEFDENQTAHISCIDNENDALGLPEQEPIYTEEQVAETGQSGQVAPEVVAPGQSGQIAEPRLQVAPGEIQPSAEKADHQTPDEVVTDPMPSPSRTVVRRTDVRTGQVPSSRTTDLRTGQVPLSRTTDLRTGHRTNQERRVTRSHRLSEHTALAAHTASTANPPNPPDLLAANPSDSDPRSYREALNSPLYKHWKSAMQEEYASLMENNAFTLVKHTESKPIGCKWVYKMKHYPDGTLRYNARLVVKGYE